MTQFSWTPITSTFGAEVHGFDISASIPDGTAQALTDLWLERGLLLFRGQQIDDATQVRFTEVFGPAPIHKASDTHVGDQPQLITISHSPSVIGQTPVYDVAGQMLANWQPWHIDTIYTAEIEHGGMLRAIEVPAEGADTGFLDRAEAWDRLPEDLKAEALNLRVLYHLTPIFARCRFRHGNARLLHVPERIAQLERRGFAEFPVVSHPAVIEHPRTGRRVLNVGPLHSIGIEGRENAEGDDLLRRLVAASIVPVGRYYHHWQPHDVVVWDNWRLMHSAEGTPVNATRKLYRSGIGGNYGLGRVVRMMSAAA